MILKKIVQTEITHYFVERNIQNDKTQNHTNDASQYTDFEFCNSMHS